MSCSTITATCAPSTVCSVGVMFASRWKIVAPACYRFADGLSDLLSNGRIAVTEAPTVFVLRLRQLSARREDAQQQNIGEKASGMVVDLCSKTRRAGKVDTWKVVEHDRRIVCQLDRVPRPGMRACPCCTTWPPKEPVSFDPRGTTIVRCRES